MPTTIVPEVAQHKSDSMFRSGMHLNDFENNLYLLFINMATKNAGGIVTLVRATWADFAKRILESIEGGRAHAAEIEDYILSRAGDLNWIEVKTAFQNFYYKYLV